MRKRRFLKLQIFLLVITVGLIVWRMNSSGPKGDGFVFISDMSVNHLYSKHFTVAEEAVVYVNSFAAFESDELSSSLAVYGWILNRATEEVAWKPEPLKTIRDGVKASISDSTQLSPGTYTAYYSTYGPTSKSSKSGSFLGLKPHWTNDPSFWSFSLTSNAPAGTISELKNFTENSTSDFTELVWSFVPTRTGQMASQMIQVDSATELKLDMTLAVCSTNCDKLELVQLPKSTPVWQLTEDMTTDAGGSKYNRAFEGSVAVAPGLYKISFEAGRNQVSSSWKANPPWAPDNWGVRLYSSNDSQAHLFDPWSDSEPLVSLLKAESNEDLSLTLELDKTLSVVVYGMGEIDGEGSNYDYGWIEREGQASYIWEMSYNNSSPAGGDRTNREEMAILTLEPGRYFIHYVSDGSHDFGSWNRSRPSNSERWGIAVFPMNPAEVTADAVRVKAMEQAWRPDGASSDVDEVMGTALVRQNKLGNDVQVDERFVLEKEAILKIVAAGELTSSSSYDYGWIQDLSSGETVWEMTFRNTVPAGGEDRNRRFSGTITLGPGEYLVHFETDLSHSFGSFDDTEPDNGQDWGIAVYHTNQ
jgi:hypothetical protein